MASEYTPNRTYPLYVATDKPNLRDQYNGAIRKIDTDMAQALKDSGDVSDALGAGYDAQHTVRMAIDGVSASISNETTARENADTALGTRITDEATARANADTALGTRITNETTARESADTALGTRITNEVTARENADTSLNSAISAEATARQNADTSINNAINTINGKITLAGYKGIIYGDSTFVENSHGTSNLGTLIQQTTGMQIANRAVSGTKLSDLVTTLNSAGASDFSGYDFVFLAYCTNDWQSGTKIWDGMYASTADTFHDKLLAAFDRLDAIRGDCKPVFVTPAYAKNPNLNTLQNAALNTNGIGNTLENYVDCVLVECHKRGYAVIDLYHTMGVSENNYQLLFTRSSDDPSHEWYNVFVHYSQLMKQRIARAFLDYFPYMVPADMPRQTRNGFIANYKYPITKPETHNPLNSRVPIVSNYLKGANETLVFDNQILSGCNTISFYAVGFSGNVKLEHFNSSGTVDKTMVWKMANSGHYDLYVDDLFGIIRLTFTPDTGMKVNVGNMMITDGHNQYPSYTLPSGCTSMKHSPAGWSAHGDATKVFTQISGNNIAIYFDRFTVTSALSAGEELMIIGNANMNVARASIIVPVFTSAENWHYVGLNFYQRNNGISVQPQKPLASGAMIDCVATVPIISPYISENEAWA